MSVPALQTARLRLRPCDLDDVDVLFALWRDPDVRRYLWDDRQISRDEAQDMVQQFLDRAQRGLAIWILEAADDGKLVGFTAIKEIAGTPHVELYYGLTPDCWGRGYATEASRALLEYGFEVLGLPRMWARTDPPNRASMRVAERLGMRPTEDPSEASNVTYVIEREDFSP
ncbi:MAG: N-acetyltransferase [Planctomycetota bacterium]|nr:MAG: N-acetyltransferase [Planctomycetota bacterium]